MASRYRLHIRKNLEKSYQALEQAAQGTGRVTIPRSIYDVYVV